MSLLDAIERQKQGLTKDRFVERESSFMGSAGVAGKTKNGNAAQSFTPTTPSLSNQKDILQISTGKGIRERQAEAKAKTQELANKAAAWKEENRYQPNGFPDRYSPNRPISFLREVYKSEPLARKREETQASIERKKALQEELQKQYQYLTDEHWSGTIGGYDKNQNNKLDLEEVESYPDFISQIVLKGIVQPLNLVGKSAVGGLATAVENLAYGSAAIADGTMNQAKRNLSAVDTSGAKTLQEAAELMRNKYSANNTPQDKYFYNKTKSSWGAIGEDARQQAAEYAQNAYGSLGGVTNDLISSVTQMAPSILAAIATQGVSAPESLAGYGSTLLKAAEMLKIPSHMAPTFVMQTGQSYDKSVSEGVEPREALAFAIIDAYVNTLIEKGGVQENVAKGTVSGGWKNFVKDNVIGEGMEEVSQNVASADLRKLGGLNNAPVFSMSDEDAVINPKRDAYSFAMGSLAGGLMGAATGGFSTNKEAARQTRDAQSPYSNVQNASGATANTVSQTEDVQAPSHVVRNASDIAASGDSIPQNVENSNRNVYSAVNKTRQREVEQERYLQQIKEVMEGKGGEIGEVVLGSTPSIYKNYGSESEIITMSPSSVRKIAYPDGYMGGKHNLGFYALEQLPAQLENPVAILRSETVPDSLVVFTELSDAENRPVMVPIILNKNGRMGVANKAASMYGRKNFEAFIERQRKAGTVLYEKERDALENLPKNTISLNRIQADSDPMLQRYKEKEDVAPISVERLQLPEMKSAQASSYQEKIPLSDADVGPVPTANENAPTSRAIGVESSPSDISIPQNAENGNGNFYNSANNGQAVLAEQDAAYKVMEILTDRYGAVFRSYRGDSRRNGYFDPKSGVIYINENATSPMVDTVAHEFLHLFKQIDPEGYSWLKAQVKSDMTMTGFEQYKSELLAAYDEMGIDYSSMTAEEIENMVIEEAMSDLMSEVMRDPKTIERIAKENRTLAQKIIDCLERIIEDIRQALSSRGGVADAEIRALVQNFDEVKAAYQEILAQSRGTFENRTQTQQNGFQYSYGGKKARQMDIGGLSKAKRMRRQGADRNQIYRETGWFVGLDGKWRFEIDDSEMTLDLDGANKKKEAWLSDAVKQLRQEEPELTEAEAREIILEDENPPLTVRDFVKHDKLFQNYPELADIDVLTFKGNEVLGGYNPNLNVLAVDVSNQHDTRAIFIHELQHAVQALEGFTRGSHPDMWDGTENEKFYNYYYTAGEVEAREVGKRLDMTEEQRKNNMPLEDAPSVVYAEDAPRYGASYSIQRTKDGKKYVQADRQVIYSSDPSNWGKEVENYINEKIRQGKDVFIPTEEGDNLKITSDTAWKLGDHSNLSETEAARKMSAATHIDELAKISKYDKTKRDVGGKHKNKKFSPDKFDYRTAFFRDFDGEYYSLSISVGVDKNGKTVYSIGNIKQRGFPAVNGSSEKTSGALTRLPSDNSIPNEKGSVKNNIRNSGGNDASEIKNSVVRRRDRAQEAINKHKGNDDKKQNEYSINSLNDNTKNGMINDSVEADISREDDSEILWLSKREYAMVSKAIMAKNAGLHENELKPVDYVYAVDEMYIYNNQSLGEFTIEKKLSTTKDVDEILVREFGAEKAANIREAAEWFRKQYDDLVEKINAVIEQIYPGQPDRLIQKRKNYMRHFRELSGAGGLKNILTMDNNITPNLVGTSEFTQPKAKFASIKQERETTVTDEGALEGFLNYLPQAMNAIYIDPYIETFRGMARDLAEIKTEMNDTSLNEFIGWLQDYANDLAGKTSFLDRWILKFPKSRTVLKALNWFNNRTKANAVVGNVASTAKQVMNISNGIKLLDNPFNIVAGICDTMRGWELFGLNRENGTHENYDKSNFLTERLETGKAERKFQKNGLTKAAQWLLGAADEFGTRSIWNAAYREGLNIEGADNPEAAARYADKLTRAAVGGRGIGEIPLVYNSQVGKLFLPFQIEVNNTWNAYRDVLTQKRRKGKLQNEADKAMRMALGFLAVWGLGEALEKLTGSKGAFDPIGDIVDGILQGFEEEKDESTGRRLATGALRAGQNLAGDFIGSRAFGWVAAELLSGINDEWAEDWFNDSVYSSQGVNVPAVQSLIKTGRKLADGNYVGAGAEFASSFVTPFGGKQIDKAVRGIGDVARGGSYQSDIYKERSTGERGDMYYEIEQTPGKYIQAALFGPSSLSENSEHWSGRRLADISKTEAKKLENEQTKEFEKQYKKQNPDSEVVRLYNEIKHKDVFPFEPMVAAREFTEKGQKYSFALTEAQMKKYQKQQNELMEEEYEKAFQTEEYKKADGEGKREILKDARQAAKKKVNQQIKDDYKQEHGIGKVKW